jgi:hypothetical protein
MWSELCLPQQSQHVLRQSESRTTEQITTAGMSFQNGSDCCDVIIPVQRGWMKVIYNGCLIYSSLVCTGWSSGQSSWLQIRRPRFDSRHYQKKNSSGSGTWSTQPREYN